MCSHRLQNYARWWVPANKNMLTISDGGTADATISRKWDFFQDRFDIMGCGEVKSYCTIWGSWMSVRLLIRAWLRRASSFRRLSLCCSIILFSSSIVFRLHSIEEICFRGQSGRRHLKTSGFRANSREQILRLRFTNRLTILTFSYVCFYVSVFTGCMKM